MTLDELKAQLADSPLRSAVKLDAVLDTFRREAMIAALVVSNGNITRAARKLSMCRSTFLRYRKAYKIEVERG